MIFVTNNKPVNIKIDGLVVFGNILKELLTNPHPKVLFELAERTTVNLVDIIDQLFEVLDCHIGNLLLCQWVNLVRFIKLFLGKMNRFTLPIEKNTYQ